MTDRLVFPDGVRLAHFNELPGPEAECELAWSRIEAADIRSGFVLHEAEDAPFPFYAEVNVHAPEIWRVFRDLCEALLGDEVDLVMSQVHDEPNHLGRVDMHRALRLLEPHNHQLAHDGFIQFGLVDQKEDEVSEVFVAPTKHFKVWLQDEEVFRSVMGRHALPQAESLQFIDEFPRVTTPLDPETAACQEADELIRHMASVIEGASGGACFQC